ncbi:MAG: hypothetical protein CVU97_06680 [Firmicutes bacterium HGW-Firmicutes-21]|nr:MAG: hypothetical protein CVU97_06680 [Firmicutes bacterium HGW-Firmicutes-21]
MENRNSNKNPGKPLPKSNKPATARKSGISAPVNAVRQGKQSMVSQSVGMRNAVPKTEDKPAVKKRTGSVVGMNRRNPSSLHAVRSPKIITIRKKEKSPFPIAIVFTSVIVTVLFLFMMMNYAEIDKYNNEIGKLDAKITRLKNDEYNLSIKLDKKDDLVEIEKFATTELGMVKKETLPRKHISLLPNDKGEIIKYDDGEEGGFGFMLAGIGEIIRDFLK